MVVVLGVLGVAVVPALAQAVLMLEHKDAVAVLDLALGSALDAVLAQLHVKGAATLAVEEHAEHLLARAHANTSVVVHVMDVVHAVAHATDAIVVLVDALLLAEAVAQVARPVVDAVAATAVKDAVVTVSLLVVAHAGQLLSNFYISKGTQMKEIRVKLDHLDSESVERSWYEYNGAKDIIGYLMTQENVNENYLQQYINIAERRYAELEMKKNAVDRKYRPADIQNLVHYEFDFENEDLVYVTED